MIYIFIPALLILSSCSLLPFLAEAEAEIEAVEVIIEKLEK